MSEVIFKGSGVQAGYRIKIPKAIIDTLSLKVKDKLILKFDPITGKIIVEQDKENKKQGGKK
jgi:bifunctional DNA-binding transcriptional regulator/antitoxin component of YhaV-PrlF toxin-antitoxin module